MSPWTTAILILAAGALGACGGSPEDPAASGDAGAGGTAPSGPRCTGSPAPCDGRSWFDCSTFYGCDDNGVCSGSAVECGIIPTEGACTFQIGCLWSPSMSLCQGVAAGCSEIAGQVLCVSQQGCGWEAEGCSGTPKPCAYISSESGCAEQPGCSWE